MAMRAYGPRRHVGVAIQEVLAPLRNLSRPDDGGHEHEASSHV